MVETVEAVSEYIADAGKKVDDINQVESTQEDFNSLSVDEVVEVEPVKIEPMSVGRFESALGDAFKKLDKIEVNGFAEFNEPSALSFALDQLMVKENQGRQRYSELADMLEEMGGVGTEAGANIQGMESMNSQEMLNHVQNNMNRSLDFQHRLEMQTLGMSVEIEKSSWVRAMATSLVKGTRKLITQT